MEFLVFIWLIIFLSDTKMIGKWIAEVHAWHNYYITSAKMEVDEEANKPKQSKFKVFVITLIVAALLAFLVLSVI